MIEQGFVQLVQGTSAVKAIATAGGFLAELPKDQALPSWSYTTVADSADYVLAGPVDLGSWNVQIDCAGPVNSSYSPSPSRRARKHAASGASPVLH